MALTPRQRAVVTGAAVAVAVVVPPVLIVSALKQPDLPYQESNLWVVAAAAFLLSFPIGGFVAARLDPRRAYGLGAAAAALGYGAIILLALVRRLVSGRVTGGFFVTAALLATIAVSLGVIGGHVASRRAAHHADDDAPVGSPTP